MLEYSGRDLKTAVMKLAGDKSALDDFVLSDGLPDRAGDVVEPDGWELGKFTPTALFNHNRDDIIGKWERVRVEKKQLRGALVMAKPGTSPVVDMVHALSEQGLLDTVSVGFRAIDAEPIDPSDPFGPMRFKRAELLEASLVAVPANPRARRIAKQFLPEDQYRRMCAVSGVGEMKLRDQPGESAETKPFHVKGTKMEGTLISLPNSKRIEQGEQELVAMRDRMNEISLSIKGDPTEEQRLEIENLDARSAQTEKNLELWHKVEARQKLMISTRPESKPETKVLEGDIIFPKAWVKREMRPVDCLWKALAADFVSKCYLTSGKPMPIDQIIRERCKGDNERAIQAIADQLVTKAAVSIGSTVTTGWAAELVSTVTSDFVDVLATQSIYGALNGLGQRHTFGRNGIIKIPIRSATPTLNGSFIGEGQPIPVRRAGLTSTTLTPKKMAVISTFTRELDLHSIPAIQAVIRTAIINDTSNALDAVLISTTASTTVTPAGLKAAENVPTAVTASAATANYDKMVADFKGLISAIVTAGGDASQIVFIVNPAQAISLQWITLADGSFPFSDVANGRIRGNQVIVSRNMTAGGIIAVDASQFASVTGDDPDFDVTDTATIHEEDTTPLAIGTAGSPNTVAAPTRSLWQTYSAAIRMIMPVNWIMTRTAMVAYITAVGW